jgi:hypothetical protein
MFYLYWRVLFLFVREEEGQLDKPYPTPAKILGLLSKPGPCCTAPTVFLGFFAHLYLSWLPGKGVQNNGILA